MTPNDPSNMFEMISNFPAQFEKGLEWGSHIAFAEAIKHVTVSGMGGSALPSDLFNAVFAGSLPQPLTVNRSYTIAPRYLGPDNLVIICSFSGNTEESISAYEQALAAGSQTVVIAGGGKLIDMAQTQGNPFVVLTKESPDFQPRMGAGYFFGALTSVLIAAGWLTADNHDWVIREAEALTKFDARSRGQSLVAKLHNKIPVFYASDDLWPVARVAKIKINENTKVPAFWNYLPEANHNEMVGFSRPNGNYSIVMFKDPGADARINLRFDITAQTLRDKSSLPVEVIEMWGDSVFTKVFATLMTIDWASYYLALEDGIDPTPVAMVEDFKQAIEAAQVAA